jgi:hypothetical protein
MVTDQSLGEMVHVLHWVMRHPAANRPFWGCIAVGDLAMVGRLKGTFRFRRFRPRSKQCGGAK